MVAMKQRLSIKQEPNSLFYYYLPPLLLNNISLPMIIFIYCIYRNNVPVYVGKTTKPINVRLQQHRRGCHNINLGLWLENNSNAIIIELTRTDNINQATKLEREWTEKLKAKGYELFNVFYNGMEKKNSIFNYTLRTAERERLKTLTKELKSKAHL